MIDLRQKELAEWQNRNFPRSRYEEMTKDQLIDMILAMQFSLGMAEEVGEVAHHILKGVQGIRNGVNGFDVEQIGDGVVDSGVFGQQLLSHFGIDSEKVTEVVIDAVLRRDWLNNPSGSNLKEETVKVPKMRPSPEQGGGWLKPPEEKSLYDTVKDNVHRDSIYFEGNMPAPVIAWIRGLANEIERRMKG